MANLAGPAHRYHTYGFDRRGHGPSADVDGPISYEKMADDAIALMDAVVSKSTDGGVTFSPPVRAGYYSR